MKNVLRMENFREKEEEHDGDDDYTTMIKENADSLPRHLKNLLVIKTSLTAARAIPSES